MAKTYRATAGINYGPDDARIEPGDIVEVPDKAARTLLARGALEHVDVEAGQDVVADAPAEVE